MDPYLVYSIWKRRNKKCDVILRALVKQDVMITNHKSEVPSLIDQHFFTTINTLIDFDGYSYTLSMKYLRTLFARNDSSGVCRFFYIFHIFSDIQPFRHEHHWRALISRNANLVYQNSYRIRFTTSKWFQMLSKLKLMATWNFYIWKLLWPVSRGCWLLRGT
jgi:hypothetical protein